MTCSATPGSGVTTGTMITSSVLIAKTLSDRKTRRTAPKFCAAAAPPAMPKICFVLPGIILITNPPKEISVSELSARRQYNKTSGCKINYNLAREGKYVMPITVKFIRAYLLIKSFNSDKLNRFD